ncbi:MAG: recombinase family protein [Bacilli bacterium]|nr:recombinase family protein [Bacilli bacterium]
MKNTKKKKDNRRIAIYSRKSKYTGKGESTKNQIEMCKRKISFQFDDIDLENDILIYEDEGFTGYNMNRPAFQRMLKDIRDNKIKLIAFYKLDRISRNVTDFSNLVAELDNYDVVFLSATENIENVTPSGRAMMYMSSVFAQLERDNTAERIRDNMIDLAKTGRWLGGNTPTGFSSEQIESISIDGKKRKLFKLTENEEMPTVITLFKKMLELKSLTKLETYTIQHDIKTKNGKYYTRWALKNILTNPVYTFADKDTLEYFKNFDVDIYAEEKDFNGEHGLMVYNKTEHKGKNKIVIKRDIEDWIISIGKHKGFIIGKDWIEVQEILIKNSDMRYRKASTSNALLSGILRCSHCGSFMRPKLKNKTISDDGRKRFDYMCELKEKSKKQKCECKNINGLEADDLVMEKIRELANPSSLFYQSLKKISKDNFSEQFKNNEELKSLKIEMTKNEKNIASLLDKIKYIDIELLDDISKEIKSLKEQNLKIEQEIKKITSKDYEKINDKDTADILLNILDNYFNNFYNLDLNTKRTLIKTLVSTITSDGNDITINFIGARNIKDDTFPTGVDSK